MHRLQARIVATGVSAIFMIAGFSPIMGVLDLFVWWITSLMALMLGFGISIVAMVIWLGCDYFEDKRPFQDGAR